MRDLIKTQNYEINLMKYSKITNKTNLELNDQMSNNDITMDSSYRYTLGDFTKPNTPYLSNVFCDPGFFTISHNKNLLEEIVEEEKLIGNDQAKLKPLCNV